ncbi:MAG: hypothetical protein FWF08_06020 [Oscillospiraceae bacterium]|nr:hypothetical protein [Oscillospiraceae bacterium]
MTILPEGPIATILRFIRYITDEFRKSVNFNGYEGGSGSGTGITLPQIDFNVIIEGFKSLLGLFDFFDSGD